MVRKRERERKEEEKEKSVRDFRVLKPEFIAFSIFQKKFHFKTKFRFLAKNHFKNELS